MPAELLSDPATDTDGQELTELPPLDLLGKNLADFATYVRKITPGGIVDFQLSLATLLAQTVIGIVTSKTQMRSLNPQSPFQLCFCLGGGFPNDNQGGIYFTQISSDLDNDGDRIRPTNYIGFVWYKWLI